MSKEKTNFLKDILKVVLALVFLAGLNFIAPQYSKNKDKTLANVSESINKKETAELSPKINIEIEATSGCVFDVSENKFVFEKNLNKRLPLASLTKIMTAITAKENLLESTTVLISKEALLKEGDNGLDVGARWQLNDILKAMLISSSNDAAFAVASSLREGNEITDTKFVKLMNRKAGEMQLNQTSFQNTSGLDLENDTVASNFGSCKDMTSMMAYMLKNYPNILEATSREKIILNGKEFKNTNKIIFDLPVLLGGKTGFSDTAGGNLSVVVNRGLANPVIITILGSSLEGRFEDVKTLHKTFVK